MFLSIFYLIKTTLTEPGIIPRGNIETPEEAMQLGLITPEDMKEALEQKARGRTERDQVGIFFVNKRMNKISPTNK